MARCSETSIENQSSLQDADQPKVPSVPNSVDGVAVKRSRGESSTMSLATIRLRSVLWGRIAGAEGDSAVSKSIDDGTDPGGGESVPIGAPAVAAPSVMSSTWRALRPDGVTASTDVSVRFRHRASMFGQVCSLQKDGAFPTASGSVDLEARIGRAASAFGKAYMKATASNVPARTTLVATGTVAGVAAI